MRGAIAGLVCALALLGWTGSASAQNRLAILMPGSGGAVPIDFLVRNEVRIRGAGIETLVTTSSGQAASVTQSEMAKGRKVVLVGMSLGAVSVAQAITGGARSSGVVLVSGVLDMARNVLGSPAALPATLVVHHPRDGCTRTSPLSAEQFVAWAGRKAMLRWIDTRGEPSANLCGPRGAHGFHMQDGAAVAAIVAFIRAR